MTTESIACECQTCVGPACTCGCQNRPAASASCQCGDVCNCGPTCSCAGCQHAHAPTAESR